MTTQLLSKLPSRLHHNAFVVRDHEVNRRFFEDVLDYCASVVDAAAGDERRQRLNFWGTLALMRCVASSPAAAVQALQMSKRLVVDGEVGAGTAKALGVKWYG